MSKPIICIGIVAYDGLDGQVSQDYMRLMYHLGRRCPEYDFQLAIKSKSEQFRARNAIVKAGLQYGADYIWMLDDDHIIDINGSQVASSAYDLPIKLVKHLEDNEKIGVVGALYNQRGADCYPVIMQESDNDERPYFLTHAEISHRMQKVDITGGGCVMIRSSVFDKIEEPWFKPEHEWGTDIQLCKQVRAAGWEVWCDTSLEIGHLKTDKQLITLSSIKQEKEVSPYEPLVRYRDDALNYLGMTDMEQVGDLSAEYNMSEIDSFDDLEDYYRSRGKCQLARQVIFHHFPSMIDEMKVFHSLINTSIPGYGVDFGCGSAPVGFEFALRGHKMDFIDIDGSGAYEFTKWRAKKHGVDCGWELAGPYDYALMLDSIEHLKDWRGILYEVIKRMKPGAVLITDYFYNKDFENAEHISMDHGAVREHLVALGMQRQNDFIWVKDPEMKEEAA